MTSSEHFLQDHMTAKQWLRSACANAQADQSHCFALISQTSQLSVDERWAHMQSFRTCCATAEISVSRLHLHKVLGYAPGTRKAVFGFCYVREEVYTADSRYLDFAYFEKPHISKRKSGPCFNNQNNVQKRRNCSYGEIYLFSTIVPIYL